MVHGDVRSLPCLLRLESFPSLDFAEQDFSVHGGVHGIARLCSEACGYGEKGHYLYSPSAQPQVGTSLSSVYHVF